MKRITSYIFTIFLLLLIIPKVYALEVSEGNVTIENGGNKKVELYANVSENITSVTFTLVFSTYDIPADFTPASGANDTNPYGISHTVVFDEAKTGRVLVGTVNISVKANPTDKVGAINIHTATARTTDGNTINLEPKNIDIKVGTPTEEPKEEPKEVDKNLLDKIESKIVKIELKKDVFDYTVEIDKDVTELDLKATPKDSSTKVEISSQKIDELKDNIIVITAKNGNTEQKYNIKVKVKEEEITIDKDEFKEDKSYKGKWIVVSIVLIVALLISMLLSKKK